MAKEPRDSLGAADVKYSLGCCKSKLKGLFFHGGNFLNPYKEQLNPSWFTHTFFPHLGRAEVSQTFSVGIIWKSSPRPSCA